MMKTPLVLKIVLLLGFAFNSPVFAENKKAIRWAVQPSYAHTASEVAPPPEDDVQPPITPPPTEEFPIKLNNTPTSSPTSSPTVNDATPPPNVQPTPVDDAETEARLDNEVRLLWDEIHKMEEQQSDITVLPIAPPKNPPTTANKTPSKTAKTKPKTKKELVAEIKAEKERIDALLRQQQGKDKNGKVIANVDKSGKKTGNAPVVSLPQPVAQPKPVLTRRQVLDEEIAREKAALKSAKSQLAIALKRGNAAAVARLNTMIRDRELNVQALQREINR